MGVDYQCIYFGIQLIIATLIVPCDNFNKFGKGSESPCRIELLLIPIGSIKCGFVIIFSEQY